MIPVAAGVETTCVLHWPPDHHVIFGHSSLKRGKRIAVLSVADERIPALGIAIAKAVHVKTLCGGQQFRVTHVQTR